MQVGFRDLLHLSFDLVQLLFYHSSVSLISASHCCRTAGFWTVPVLSVVFTGTYIWGNMTCLALITNCHIWWFDYNHIINEDLFCARLFIWCTQGWIMGQAIGSVHQGLGLLRASKRVWAFAPMKLTIAPRCIIYVLTYRTFWHSVQARVHGYRTMIQPFVHNNCALVTV